MQAIARALVRGRRLSSRLHCCLAAVLVEELCDAEADSYIRVLERCGRMKDIQLGRGVHEYMITRGADRVRYLANYIIQMYSKCGCLNDARAVFDCLSPPNHFSYTFMIVGYTQAKCPREAIELYHKMLCTDVKPSIFTYSSVVTACSLLGDLKEGKQLHRRIMAEVVDVDVVLGTALIDMYFKCSSITDARTVFDGMKVKNAFTWTVMIGAYAHNEQGYEALRLFHSMDNEGISMDAFVYSSVLDACGSMKEFGLAQGKAIHQRIIASGETRVLQTSVMSMYAHCGCLNDAEEIFESMLSRDVVAWSAMISAYVDYGCNQKAIEIFYRMVLEGCKPDKCSFLGTITACAAEGDAAAAAIGNKIHAVCIEAGYSNIPMVLNALMSMYSKCGCPQDTLAMFTGMKEKTAASWNSMIMALVAQGKHREAVETFKRMKKENVEAVEITYSCVLSACAELSASAGVIGLIEGRAIHEHIIRQGWGSLRDKTVVGNALVSFYGKCGSLIEARRVFEEVSVKDVFGYSSLIVGYAHYGQPKEALLLFERMKLDGVSPDRVIFTNILHACSHAGLLDRGWQYFVSMKGDFGIEPDADQFVGMVDLLARSGRICASEELMENMPYEPCPVGWKALLSACKTHGDLIRAPAVADRVLQITGRMQVHVPYLLLSNVYAESAKDKLK